MRHQGYDTWLTRHMTDKRDHWHEAWLMEVWPTWGMANMRYDRHEAWLTWGMTDMRYAWHEAWYMTDIRHDRHSGQEEWMMRHDWHYVFWTRGMMETWMTPCLQNIYILFTQCLQPIYTMLTPCLHKAYTLLTLGVSATACLHCLHYAYTELLNQSRWPNE